MTIFIDDDNDAVRDGTELSTTTDASGNWSFTNLDGSHAGAKVREAVSGDFVTTIGGDGIAVTGTSGADQTGLLFANFDPYTLSGKKLIDLNGNSAIDGNDATTPHAGVVIFIDDDNDAVRDGTELSTTTDASGNWSFTNLGGGHAGAKVREDVSGDFITTIGGDGIAVTGTSGADQTGLLFANFDQYTLSGKKLIDLNGNSAIDGNDATTPHAGVVIFIDDDNDAVRDGTELSTTTDASGNWSFTNLGGGHAGAKVREDVSGDFITTIGGTASP